VLERHRDADLIVFSELSTSGYYPQDLLEESWFLQLQERAIARLIEASRSHRAAIVAGLVTRNLGPGKRLRNSLVVLKGGEPVLYYHKQLLPTYNVFDERRHFEPGPAQTALMELKGQRIGFLICEDAWNDAGQDYLENPLAQLSGARVDAIVSINASPSDVGKRELRHKLLSSACARHRVPLLYVNQIGGNDQLVYDGASFAADAAGVLSWEGKRFEEHAARLQFSEGRFYAREATAQLGETISDAAFYYRQTTLGLKDYASKSGFRGVVVGSSGGIDSALTLALAADTLGSDNVRAITMPSRISSSGSVTDSVALCKNLGVRLYNYPISRAVADFEQGFRTVFGVPAAGLTLENVQPRERGLILMAYSNHFGHLVLTTGNKSELSVGYATLYGDMSGGLNVIGDLYKTEVIALARYCNELHGTERIPAAICTKEPSAELASGQKDTDSLPPYPVLDEILKFYIEGERLRVFEFAAAQRFVQRLHAQGQGPLIQKVLTMVARSEFKRRQAPPIIRLRPRAFGSGRQIPIVADFHYVPEAAGVSA
jgi:NAD+ synthetase